MTLDTAVLDWRDLCAIDDIPVQGSRRAIINGHEIGIFRTSSSEIYAIDNTCPHKQGPLTEGIVHDCSVTCPLHNWVFDLKTGVAQGQDEGSVTTHPIQIRDDRVYIQLKG